MLILGKPSNISNFIPVEYTQSFTLQENGFIALYRDDKYVYFKKTKELLDFMNGGEKDE